VPTDLPPSSESAAPAASAAFDATDLARRLAQAYDSGKRLPAAIASVTTEAQAYAVQDAWMAQAQAGGNPVAGWKVGANTNDSPPNAAPLPAICLRADGSDLGLGPGNLRGIELELAVRLRHDLMPGDRPATRQEVVDAIGEVLPVIELVDSRWIEARQAPALARLADLQSHGALVLGAPVRGLDPHTLDLTQLHTRLTLDGATVVDVTGGHTAPDLWRLLGWLAWHAQARGLPLRAGQVLTTGSCTGLVIAAPGALVQGELVGLGRVSLRV
jgi:2-keto-4-pentenoate hydratase